MKIFTVGALAIGCLLQGVCPQILANTLPIQALQTQAADAQLSDDIEWLRLFHYYPSSRSSSGIESHVDGELTAGTRKYELNL